MLAGLLAFSPIKIPWTWKVNMSPVLSNNEQIASLLVGPIVDTFNKKK